MTTAINATLIKTSCIAGLLLLTLCFSASAKTENIDFMSYSLEDLLTISVDIVSKKNEDFLDAPGVVSVITKEQIQRYGAQTLGEVIERFPSVYKNNLFLLHDSYMGVRGQSTSGIDARTLLTLNGRPLREYFSGGANNNIYRGIPLSAIERIEMIRGPGSVLYGSNAFSGVINIVTKTENLDSGTSITNLNVNTGSFGTKGLEAGYQTMAGQQLTGQTFVRSQRVEGWEYHFTDSGIPAFGIPSTTDTANVGYKQDSIFSSWQYASMGIDIFYNQLESDSIGADSLWPIAESLLAVQRQPTSYGQTSF